MAHGLGRELREKYCKITLEILKGFKPTKTAIGLSTNELLTIIKREWKMSYLHINNSRLRMVLTIMIREKKIKCMTIRATRYYFV